MDLCFDFLSVPMTQTPDQEPRAVCGDDQVREVLDRWRLIGSSKGLFSDLLVAKFLIESYDSSIGRDQWLAHCDVCQTPLTLCCLACPPSLPPPLAHDARDQGLAGSSPSASAASARTDTATMTGSKAMSATSSVVNSTSTSAVDSAHSSSWVVNPASTSSSNLAVNSNPVSAISLVSSSKLVVNSSCSIVTKSSAVSAKLSPAQDSAVFSSHSDAIASTNSTVHVPVSSVGCAQSLYTDPCSLSSQRDVAVSNDLPQGEKLVLCADSIKCRETQVAASCHESSGEKAGDSEHVGSDFHKNLSASECSNTISTDYQHRYSNSTASTDVERFKCLMCSELFLDSDQVTRHMLSHGGDLNHCCRVCGASFLSLALLQRHQKAYSHSHHSAIKTVQGNQQHTTTENTVLKGEKEPDWSSREVGPKYDSGNPADDESRIGPGPFGCQHCGKSFRFLDALAMHAGIHYQPTKCEKCSEVFTSTSLRKEHHCPRDRQRRFTSHNSCDLDSMSFSIPSKLADHVETYTGKCNSKRKGNSCKQIRKTSKRPPDHSCDICQATFPTARKLQQHRKEHHSKRRLFQCGHCGKELCNMQTLAAHERTHTGLKPYKCPECPSTFRSGSNLRAHLRTHSGHTPYLCPQCGRGFKEITHLKRHLVSHSGERPHQCQECGKAYVHATSLKEHMQSHQPASKSWVCHQCGKAFANSKKLKVHIKTHSSRKEEGKSRSCNRRLYTCQVCGAIYRQASSLSRHKKLHEAGPAGYSCSHCDKTFRDRFELKKHGKVHRGPTPYRCGQCDRSFRDALGYKRHLLSHGGSKSCVCPQCGKGCADSRSLKLHLRSHTGLGSHSCQHCSKAFFTGWTLRLHLLHHVRTEGGEGGSIPAGEKSHVCNQCGSAYLRASSLVRHQRLHQAAAGQSAGYKCPQCSRSFGDSSHLKRHLISHSGEKPFVCASCGKAYADSHTLKDHMQVHSGVRSFICEVCGKAFFNAKTLREHARSHSDLRPFQCTQCPAAYKHLSGLISHRRLHSGVRPFQCGQCGKTFKDYTCYKRHLLTHSHLKPHVCQQCGKGYKDLKNLRHHQVQLHGKTS